MEKAGIYIRVSDDDQTKAFGPETQKRVCLEYCAKNDLEVYKIFDEGHITGTSEFLERDVAKQLISDLKAGLFTHIVVHDLSRLERPNEAANEVNRLTVLLFFLSKWGATIHDATKLGKVTYGILGELQVLMESFYAQQERKTMRIRLSGGKIQKAKSGRFVGAGRVTYGYRKQGLKANCKLAIYEPEAFWVRKIFDWYLAGMSAYAITMKLDEQGAPRPEFRKLEFWCTSTVHRILQNETYCGKWLYRAKDPVTREPTPVVVDMPEIEIITRETWQAAQDRRAMNKRLSSRNTKFEYLLMGFFKCGLCGGSMASLRFKETRYYRCGNLGRTLAAFYCANRKKMVSAKRVEGFVWDWITMLLTDEIYLLAGLRELAERSDEINQEKATMLEQVKASRIEIETRLKRATDELLNHSDDIVLASLRSEINRLSNVRKSFEAEQAKLEAALNQTMSNEAVQEKILTLARDVRDKLPKMSFKNRRELLAMLGVKVVLENQNGERTIVMSCELPASTIEIDYSSSSYKPQLDGGRGRQAALFVSGRCSRTPPRIAFDL